MTMSTMTVGPRDTTVATTVDSPIGQIHLASDGEAITACWFGDPTQLWQRLDLTAAPRQAADLGELSKRVSAYIDGDLSAIDDVPVRQPGGAFRQQCWTAMRGVPAGETISYAELASRAGHPTAARAAGTACAVNLVALIVPCHRIVTSGGGLGGYAYGLPAKRWLLDHERGQKVLA